MAEKAKEKGALSATWWPAKEGDHEINVVSLVIENRSVNSLLERLHPIDEASVLLYPHEVLTFRSPASQLPKELQTLQPRSPLEIFLLSIQSTGSWPSFLGYAAAGGVLTWIGFYTNSVYLLIAAMLIAPFAGPAMNVALATATGDVQLYRRSLARYVVGILFTIAVTALLSFAFQQSIITGLMTGVGHVSAAAALLPLVAGAAGAFNLMQSERSSLVAGTAVGMLVTASLAPPAALIGVASVMQEWSLVFNAVFQLTLQLVGINLAGSVVFRQRGLTTSLRQYQRGTQSLFYISLAITVIALAGLLTWQFTDPLRFERSSESTRAAEVIREVIAEDGQAQLVSVDATFKASEANGNDTLVAIVYVQRSRGHTDDFGKTMAEELERILQRELQDHNPKVIPLVQVVVLDPPPERILEEKGE
jgi:uncharacterized hydrophobic protein (TIGR00271 family)